MECPKSVLASMVTLIIIFSGLLGLFHGLPTAYAIDSGSIREADGSRDSGNRGGMASKLSPKDWPQAQSDLRPDPQAQFGRLSNGFRYVLLPNPKPKNRTSIHLVVQAGSLQETETERGVAHFLEHMLFNGSTHFPPGELVKYFQKIGMQFGPDANAHTGFYETVYDINLPVSDHQSLREALQVMQDYAEGALLLPSEIERERGVILAEKRARDSAEYRSYVASLAFELAGTRFPDRLPIGSEAVIQSADRSVFKAFYDAWYRPDNMILVMVGDFDPVLARELVEAQFMHMAARAPARENPATGQVKHEKLKTFFHHEKELGSTSVALQVLTHDSNSIDTADVQRRQIEDQLTNQILRNRLNRALNQAGSPITDVSAGSGIFLRQIRYGYISADCQPKNWRDALSLIEQTLRQALQYGFGEEELERVKKDYRAGLEQAVAQAGTRDSSALARELIQSLLNDRVFRSPEQEKALAELVITAATTQGLQDRLRAIWGEKHRLVLVTGNAAIVPPSGTPEDQIAAVFNQSQATPVSRPVKVQRAVFPYLPPPLQEGRIATQQEQADIGVSLIRFENDIRLNVKSTDFTADEIQFVLSFGDGRAGVPRDKSALAALADELVNESGLGRLDKEALAQALAGKKTAIHFGVRDDRFTLEGRTTPDEMELMFQLLLAHIVDPAFREDAWQLALNRYQQTYRTLQQSVNGVMNLYGWRFLSGEDRRFGLPSPEAFEGLSVTDVESWIVPALRQGAMELAVVGDMDRETVVRMAARYLGSLPGKRAEAIKTENRTGPVFPAARQMNADVISQIEKAQLVMAFPTDDMWDIGRTRRLNILAEIVSERLRLRIREKLGAAYSPGAFSHPSRTYTGYGLFIIYIPLAPKLVDTVQTEVEAIIRDIRQDGISPEELQRALEPTLTGIKDRFRENGYWLNTVLAGASFKPVQLDWCRTIIADYASIRAGDIEQLAQRYLDLSKRAVIRARSVGGA
jgi:zinc protease